MSSPLLCAGDVREHTSETVTGPAIKITLCGDRKGTGRNKTTSHEMWEVLWERFVVTVRVRALFLLRKIVWGDQGHDDGRWCSLVRGSEDMGRVWLFTGSGEAILGIRHNLHKDLEVVKSGMHENLLGKPATWCAGACGSETHRGAKDWTSEKILIPWVVLMPSVVGWLVDFWRIF